MNENWPLNVRRKDPKRTHPLLEILWAAGDIEQGKVAFEVVRGERFYSHAGDGYLERALRRIVIPLRYRSIFTLEYLNSSLGRLKGDSRILRYRKELQNYDQFWDAYSEIECATIASKTFRVELKPRVGDLKVTVNDTPVLIEVRAARPPSFRSSGFRGSKVPQMLIEKSKQLGRLPTNDRTPCVLIIDASGSVIEAELEIPDEDSIPEPISAVLIYKMDFGWDGKSHLNSMEFVENNSAKNPLGHLAKPISGILSTDNLP